VSLRRRRCGSAGDSDDGVVASDVTVTSDEGVVGRDVTTESDVIVVAGQGRHVNSTIFNSHLNTTLF